MRKYQLRQRIHDVYSGAVGADWVDEDYYASPTDLTKILPALKSIFDPNKEKEWLFGIHNLDEFELVESATELLWRHIFK